MKSLFVIALPALLVPVALAAREGSLQAHEWGTFTSFQDERGRAVRGINVDDEPVPLFVHRLAGQLLFDPRVVPSLVQGAPRAHPHVTMRLETPVLYFHLPEGGDEPMELDVSVAFVGGWLTEFFPKGQAAAPGLRVEGGTADTLFGPLLNDAISTLSWNGLRVGAEVTLPVTEAPVWLAPRKVDAADILATSGEGERFLFYRGVAHREAPVRIVREPSGELLHLSAQAEALDEVGLFNVESQWLVDIRDDGTAAFHSLPPWVGGEQGGGIVTAASFAEEEYSAARKEALKAEMYEALHASGLCKDEATAMLRTWELSYFDSPGLRYFFIAPRTWVDHVLPLEISVDAEVERVMMGRIELVTPRQRQILDAISAGKQNLSKDLVALDGVPVAYQPSLPGYSLFVELGRFRHALLLDQQRWNPSEQLARFLEAYGIRYYALPAAP